MTWQMNGKRLPHGQLQVSSLSPIDSQIMVSIVFSSHRDHRNNHEAVVRGLVYPIRFHGLDSAMGTHLLCQSVPLVLNYQA